MSLSPRRLCWALILLAGVVAVSCADVDKIVEDSKVLRAQIRDLEQELAQLRAEFPDFQELLAGVDARVRRARESVELVRTQDPMFAQMLASPGQDLSDAIDDLRELRSRLSTMQRRLDAIHGSASAALTRADSLVQSGLDLQSRLNILRTAGAVLGTAIPGLNGLMGGPQPQASGGDTNPLAYILGTTVTAGTIGAAGYYGYRAVDYARSKKQKGERDGDRRVTNNVTVSVPPPQRASHSGLPPPGAGRGMGAGFSAGAHLGPAGFGMSGSFGPQPYPPPYAYHPPTPGYPGYSPGYPPQSPPPADDVTRAPATPVYQPQQPTPTRG